tara:strand:- start:300 stop:791 length:492 start_codon:yes stop_codon:yes gene_type:complete
MGADVLQDKRLFVKVLSTGYEPMYSVQWQSAIKDLYAGRLEIVENHPSKVIRTVTGNLPMPTIVRFRSGVFLGAIKVPPKERKPNRKNIYERDKGVCQYCCKKLSYSDATVDHVLPKSRGGKETWANLVTCCAPCNSKKGNKTPKEANMRLLRKDQYEYRQDI